MIKRIIASVILISLFIAIPLALMGYTKVDIGAPFLALMKNTSRDLNDFKVAIPNIPKIPSLTEAGFGWDVLRVIVNFFNGIVSVLNIVIMIVNYVIQLLEFLVLLIKNLINFKDSIGEYEHEFPYIEMAIA